MCELLNTIDACQVFFDIVSAGQTNTPCRQCKSSAITQPLLRKKKAECFYSVFVEIDGFLFLELLTAVTDGAVVT